jgi:SAM-dependent methyltransferase
LEGSALGDLLAAQEEAWRERPLVRRLYGEWHEELGARMSHVPGATVELGAGIGRFKERFPDTIATDVEPTRWADNVVDAEALPYDDGSLANLVLIDVFHHLARPAGFLDEASRVLASGGRCLILDPYCSPVSTVAYRFLHHERTDLNADGLEEDDSVAASPLASNQARATLVFFRQVDSFRRRWPELVIRERRRLALLLYPLSGGFSGPRLVPAASFGALSALERLLAPLSPLAAFRCLVVLERSARHK